MDDEELGKRPILTSTMGNVLLPQNNGNKNDANDSLLTSSTDADSTCSKSMLNGNYSRINYADNVVFSAASEDPISSTSSDEKQNQKLVVAAEESKENRMDSPKSLPDHDAELDINTVTAPSEPISENVEDIAQDLENLLGESDPNDDYLSRKNINNSEVDLSQTSIDDLASELDASTSQNIDETDHLSVETPEIMREKITDSTEKKEEDSLPGMNAVEPEIKSVEAEKVASTEVVPTPPSEENTNVNEEINPVEIKDNVPIISKIENNIISATTLEEELLIKKITSTAETSETNSIASSLEVLPDPEATIDEFMTSATESSTVSRQTSVEEENNVTQKSEGNVENPDCHIPNGEEETKSMADETLTEESKEGVQEVPEIVVEAPEEKKDVEAVENVIEPSQESSCRVEEPASLNLVESIQESTEATEVIENQPEVDETSSSTEKEALQIATETPSNEPEEKLESSVVINEPKSIEKELSENDSVEEKHEKEVEIPEKVEEKPEQLLEHPKEETETDEIGVSTESSEPIAEESKTIETVVEEPEITEKIAEQTQPEIRETLSENFKEIPEEISAIQSIIEEPETTEKLSEQPQLVTHEAIEEIPQKPDVMEPPIEHEIISKEIQETSSEIPSANIQPQTEIVEPVDEKMNEPSLPPHEEKTEDSEKPAEEFPETTNSNVLTEQKREPVVEEFIEKKTIIYQHDCAQNIKNKSLSSLIDDSVEKSKELEEDSPSSVEYIGSSSSQERLDKDDSNSSSSEIMKIIEKRTLSQLSKAKDTAELYQEIQVSQKIEDKVEIEVEPKTIGHIQESFSLNDGVENSQIESIDARLPQKEVDDAVSSITMDNTIQDQTTAAVQSILDNMLAEEQNLQTVSDKDETHLLHPAYSSYELQKAVQGIQGIEPQNEEPEVELVPEVPYIPQVEPEQPQEAAPVEPPQVSPVETAQVASIEPQVEPNLEQKTEVKEVAEALKEPFIEDEKEIIGDLKTEVKSKIESHVEVKKQEVDVPVVRPSIDLSEESSTSSDDSSENEKISELTNQKSRQVKPKEKTYSVESISEPLSINVDETDKEKIKCYSPKITIKLNKEDESSSSSCVEDKEEHKGSLKITITKQSDNTHSILKICSPDVENRTKTNENLEEHNVIPKLVIKTSDVEQHSPKTRGKQSTSSLNQRSGSPRITIKPIPNPDRKEGSPLKMIIKPLGKPEEFSKQQQQQQQRHSPKLPKSKNEDDHYGTRSKLMKSNDGEPHSPKVTIKPIVKPHEEEQVQHSPKITIKPVERLEVEPKTSPKITIKPVIKPVDEEERIVLKINKGNLPAEKPRKREHEEEKISKIKLKFSKGGDAHIVHESKPKKIKNNESDDDDVKIIEERHSPIVISEDSRSEDSVILLEDQKRLANSVHQAELIRPEPVIVAPPKPPPPAPRKRGRPRKVPLVVREDFANPKEAVPEVQPPPPALPVAPETETTGRGGRPKRSCRGQSVRDTLGIKPRKTKAPSKPRGGKRGPKGRDANLSAAKLDLIKKTLSDQSLVHDGGLLKIAPVPSPAAPVPAHPLELKGLLEAAKDQNIIEIIEIDSPSSTNCSEDVRGRKEEVDLTKDADYVDEMHPPKQYFAQPFSSESTMDISHSSDIAMFEEETRMSADAHSRAQTPAKQVVSSDVIVEESQSSLQSTATTESVKISRRSRFEVHQEIDASISSVDQLNEYYWGGAGPFMIQEQVAQFLGIKSFKRKYPNMPRRMVDMQERDYIRENGLASESMCDLGLTAVNSADILDIMYSDFQDKYEEYCKYQRDKQAKDLQNKQRALNAAASHEKNKLDIVQQAITSTASYNANFNKLRREQRKACMDLQTMNVHYPKGKMKALKLPKIGNYPVSVVPGQFTDYYKEFTPTELNNFPINTMLYTELHKILLEGSGESDSETSGSDTEESSSSGSESDSSCEDSCKMCNVGDKKMIGSKKSPSIHASA